MLRKEKLADIPADSVFRPEDCVTLTISKSVLIALVGAKSPEKIAVMSRLNVNQLLEAIIVEVKGATSLNTREFQGLKALEISIRIKDILSREDTMTRDEYVKLFKDEVAKLEAYADIEATDIVIEDNTNPNSEVE